MHGSTMMFLFAVPVMEAIGVYLVPLMVGTRNIAFPRLNAFSYWMYLAGGLMLWVAFVLNIGPGRRLVRLCAAVRPAILARQARRHLGADDHLHRVAALAVAVELICTILKSARAGHDARRACRCSSGRCWCTAFMVIFAMPAVALASSLLISRPAGRHPISTIAAEHGDALLWQHLFWFFGHPEVYIIFLPGDRASSAMITETFCRRPVFGYPVDGARAGRHRLSRLRPVGPPHVRDRPAAARRQLLHRREHDGLDPERRCRSSAGSRRCGTAGRGSKCRCCSSSASSSPS